jgi:hypothetical protein
MGTMPDCGRQIKIEQIKIEQRKIEQRKKDEIEKELPWRNAPGTPLPQPVLVRILRLRKRAVFAARRAG